jgi:hypothetical protein
MVFLCGRLRNLRRPVVVEQLLLSNQMSAQCIERKNRALPIRIVSTPRLFLVDRNCVSSSLGWDKGKQQLVIHCYQWWVTSHRLNDNSNGERTGWRMWDEWGWGDTRRGSAFGCSANEIQILDSPSSFSKIFYYSTKYFCSRNEIS